MVMMAKVYNLELTIMFFDIIIYSCWIFTKLINLIKKLVIFIPNANNIFRRWEARQEA
jgi:hypothetical protein